MKLVTLPLTALFLVLSATAAHATEQNVYYHLHQTYELMELNKKNGCSNAASLIKDHLKEAARELKGKQRSAFKDEYRHLASVASTLKRTPIDKVEKLRKNVQAKADLEGLRHEHAWHNELGDCSAVVR